MTGSPDNPRGRDAVDPSPTAPPAPEPRAAGPRERPLGDSICVGTGYGAATGATFGLVLPLLSPADPNGFFAFFGAFLGAGLGAAAGLASGLVGSRSRGPWGWGMAGLVGGLGPAALVLLLQLS